MTWIKCKWCLKYNYDINSLAPFKGSSDLLVCWKCGKKI